MRCVQICLALCCALQLVAANKGSYSYGYGVQDSITGDRKEQQETKNGDQVTGYYTMLEADGRTRTVKYDSNPQTGFRAVVSHSSEQPQLSAGPNAKSWSTMHRFDHNVAADCGYAAPALIPLQKQYGDASEAGWLYRAAAASPYVETRTQSVVDHGLYERYLSPPLIKPAAAARYIPLPALQAAIPAYQSSYYNGAAAAAAAEILPASYIAPKYIADAPLIASTAAPCL